MTRTRVRGITAEELHDQIVAKHKRDTAELREILLHSGATELARQALDAALDELSDWRNDACRIAAAYVQDRAEQYAPYSGSRVALEEAADGLRAGEHLAAFAHGELDDLLARGTRKVSP